MNISNELLTADEAGKLLRVSGATVRRWVRLHIIEGVRYPTGQVRIPRSEVDRLLRRGVEAQEPERKAPTPKAQPAEAARAEPATSAAVTSTDELRPLAAAIVPREDRVLMTLRRYGKHGESWSWPSGRPEPGETLEAALARELDEELHLALVRVLGHVGDIDLPSGYRMSHFAVEIPASAEPYLRDREELVETRWMTLPEVEQAISSLPAYIRDQALDYARQVVTRATV